MKFPKFLKVVCVGVVLATSCLGMGCGYPQTQPATVETQAATVQTQGKQDATGIEAIIQAHVEQVSPNTAHTIRALDWHFGEMVGSVSTEHTRRSLQQFWLVDADRGVLLEPIAATITFEKHGFAQRAAEHPPKQWAELALCSLQQSGRSLVEQVDMSALNRHWKLEDVAPPKLTSGPTLEFWTTSEYRGVDAFYQHTVSVNLGGKLSHKVSKERRFKRR